MEKLFLLGNGLFFIFCLWKIKGNQKNFDQISLQNQFLQEKISLFGKLEKKIEEQEEDLLQWKMAYTALEVKLQERERFFEEKYTFLQEVASNCKESFQSLSLEALTKSSQTFLELATTTFEKYQGDVKGDFVHKEQMIRDLFHPVCEKLEKLDSEMRKLDVDRKIDHVTMQNQITALLQAEQNLQRETAILTRALRTPTVRGRWGELQLRRVVEIAGMLSHCDFYEQTVLKEEGDLFRPDVIIQLPGKKQIVVDAKTPFESYLDAMEIQDEEERKYKLTEHAKAMRRHILLLGKKSYWQKLQLSPEFVVLFLPSETFFSSALQIDPSLIEIGAQQGVILATPTTLIGLLRAIACGWKHEALSKNSELIRKIGHDLYERIAMLSRHFAKVGKGLEGCVESYNQAVHSLESRILVSARKLKELESASEFLEISDCNIIEKNPKKFLTTECQESE